MKNLENRVDGLIFWNVDDDKLATELGQKLEKCPPKGIKVLKYTGDKDFPGWSKKSEKFLYVEDALEAIKREYGTDYHQHLLKLQNLDGDYNKKIHDWEKSLIKEYKTKFSIELHDTPTKRIYSEKRDYIDLEFQIGSFNRKLLNLLENYCRDRKFAIVNKYNIEFLYSSSRFLYTNPYHQIVLEIDYDPLWLIKSKAVNDTYDVIFDLSKFMQNQYPKLWKKFI